MMNILEKILNKFYLTLYNIKDVILHNKDEIKYYKDKNFILYYKNIMIVDSRDDYQKICDILDITDEIIVKNIVKIIIQYEDFIPKKYIKEKQHKNLKLLGTTLPYYYGEAIRILSSKSKAYKIVGNKFEKTLHHEIGHVKGSMNKCDSEQYAINYAIQQLKKDNL